MLPGWLCPGPALSPAFSRWGDICRKKDSKADAAEGVVVCSWPGSLVCVETLSLALLCGYSFSISKAIKGPKESTPLGFWVFFCLGFF